MNRLILLSPIHYLENIRARYLAHRLTIGFWQSHMCDKTGLFHRETSPCSQAHFMTTTYCISPIRSHSESVHLHTVTEIVKPFAFMKVHLSNP
jgi:hypothetical protein